MSRTENPVQRLVWLAMGGKSRLFRLNTGKAWLSALGPAGVTRLADGSVVIKAARPISLGFAAPNGDTITGAADLQGWTTVEITPDMVGHKVAVYTSIECKREKGGRTTEEQANWREQVHNAGGIAGIVNSPEAAAAVISEWHSKFKQSRRL
jgi:hypothetical protein